MSQFLKRKLRPKTTLERQSALEEDNLFFYNLALKFTRGKNVLDIGTGYGFGANYVLENGAKEVVGIDIDESAVTFANKTFENSNLDFRVMDATKINLSGKSYDVILVFDVIEHLSFEKHLVFLQKIKDLLANRGVLLLSTPNKLTHSPNQETPCNPYHLKEYTQDELKKTIKKIFPKTEMFGVKIINKEYNNKFDKLGKRFRYTFFNFFGKFRVVRDFISFIPKEIRREISKENTLPKLEINDFKLDKNKINQSKSFLIISKNIPQNQDAYSFS